MNGTQRHHPERGPETVSGDRQRRMQPKALTAFAQGGQSCPRGLAGEHHVRRIVNHEHLADRDTARVRGRAMRLNERLERDAPIP